MLNLCLQGRRVMYRFGVFSHYYSPIKPFSQQVCNCNYIKFVNHSRSISLINNNNRPALINYKNGGHLYYSSSSGDKNISNEKSKSPADKGGPFAGLLELPKESRQFQGDEADWITIYRFHNIVLVRVLQRMKIYQTVFSCFIALPIGFFSTLTGYLSPDVFSVIGCGCMAACAMLYIMGNMVTNLIGIMYVTDKDPEIVRIAHMNFWGTRVDEIYQKTDFVPFTDLPDNTLDAYVQLKLYSDPEYVMRITVKYGTIYDSERFCEIFGNPPEIPVLSEKKSKS